MEMRDPLRIVRTTAESPTSTRNWTGGGQWPKGTYEVVFHLSRDMTDPECEMVTKAIPNVTKAVGNYFVQAGTTAEEVGSKQDWYKDKLSDIEARATAHDEELARWAREQAAAHEAEQEAEQERIRKGAEHLKWE